MDPHGKWIILVHGNRKIGQDHELYLVIRNNLPLEYLVLAIDLFGFGCSTRARRKASKGIGHHSNHCVRAANPKLIGVKLPFRIIPMELNFSAYLSR